MTADTRRALSTVAPTHACRRWAIVAAGYAVVGLLMSWPLPLRLLSAIPGDGFDGWQNYWNLWWVRRALLDLGASPWHTGMLDYPAGVSLAFHTLNIPNALLSLPVQELAGLIAAYSAVVLASFALSGLGAYLLALRVIGRGGAGARAAALVAGLAYSMSPFHFAHLLGHMQVFTLQWLPFYLLALMGLLERAAVDRVDRVDAVGRAVGAAGRAGVVARAVPAVLFLVVAAVNDWYNLIYLGLVTVLWAGWYGWRARARGLGHAARPLLAAAGVGIVALALLSPLLLPMVSEAGRADYMVPDQAHLTALSADPLALVLPQEMHPLWGEATGRVAGRFPSSTSERMVSFGLAPLVLALVGWWRGRGRTRPLVWMGLAFTVLALGPVLHWGGRVVTLGGRPLPLPYLLLYETLPFMGIARSLGRYSVVAMLAVAVLAGVGVWWLSRGPGRRRWLVPSLAALAIAFEFLPAPYPMSPPDTPPWYGEAAVVGGGAILNLPANWDRPQYLLYQTVHGMPLIAGYTSRRNPLAPMEQYPGLQQLRALGDDVLAFPDAPTFATIAQDLGLRFVVLDMYQMPGGAEREVTLALAHRLLGEQAPVYQDDRLTVYQVVAPEQRRPYVRLAGGWGAPQASAGAVARRACADCGFVVVGDRCPVQLTVTCLDGRQAQATLDPGEALRLGDVVPQCAAIHSVSWLEACR